jgi:hypothetical protein
MKIGQRGSNRGGANGCRRRCSSPRWWGKRKLGWLRGRRIWTERERTPRRIQWRERGHEFEGREGRTTGRRSRAGRSNFGEESRPLERAIGRDRARASSSGGGGTPWAKAQALDEVGMARHHAGAASRHVRTPVRPNWLKADVNKVKQAWGRESHLGAELEEAWRGL